MEMIGPSEALGVAVERWGTELKLQGAHQGAFKRLALGERKENERNMVGVYSDSENKRK